MSGFFRRYLRRPVGAAFVSGCACVLVVIALRFLGESARADGASLALIAVLVVQHVYWVWVPELPSREDP